MSFWIVPVGTLESIFMRNITNILIMFKGDERFDWMMAREGFSTESEFLDKISALFELNIRSGMLERNNRTGWGKV